MRIALLVVIPPDIKSSSLFGGIIMSGVFPAIDNGL